MIAAWAPVVLAMIVLALLVPRAVLWAYDRGVGAWAERRRLRSLLGSQSQRGTGITFSDKLDLFWAKVHLPGGPMEWIAGATFGVVGASILAQSVWGNWVLDIGFPVDALFFVYFIVARTRQATYDRLVGQMSASYHIVATEYNVHKHVGAALQAAFPRLPRPAATLFESSVKMFNSGVPPIAALERLGKNLGPPYGRLFAQTLQQGLTSSSIEKLLVHIATMTEEWNVARKQARATVVTPQLIGMLLNGGFYFAAFGVRYVFPSVAAYEAAHPIIFMPGVIAVGLGFVMATMS